MREGESARVIEFCGEDARAHEQREEVELRVRALCAQQPGAARVRRLDDQRVLDICNAQCIRGS